MENMKILLTENQNLKFDLKIDGAEPEDVSFRLILHEKDFSIYFNGEVIDENTVSFNVPVLKDIIKENSVMAEIEINVNGLVVNPSPWKKMIELERPVKIVVNEHADEKDIKAKTDVSFKISEPKVENVITEKLKISKSLYDKDDSDLIGSIINELKELNAYKNGISATTKNKLLKFKKSKFSNNKQLMKEFVSIMKKSNEFKNVKIVLG